MIIEFLRKKILQKQFFARQFWEHKNNKHKSNIFNEFNLEYKRFGSKNPNVFFYLIRRSPGAGFFSNLNFGLIKLIYTELVQLILSIMKNIVSIT